MHHFLSSAALRPKLCPNFSNSLDADLRGSIVIMEGTAASSTSRLPLLSTNYSRKQANIIAPRASSFSSDKKDKIEIRVCTNRTCRKQGSLDALQVLSGVAPPLVTVNSCGCLGRCGSGPNIMILPEAVFVGHCGTPTKAADVMAVICGADGDSGRKCLEALALRKRGEDEMGRADFAQAPGRLIKQYINEREREELSLS